MKRLSKTKENSAFVRPGLGYNAIQSRPLTTQIRSRVSTGSMAHSIVTNAWLKASKVFSQHNWTFLSRGEVDETPKQATQASSNSAENPGVLDQLLQRSFICQMGVFFFLLTSCHSNESFHYPKMCDVNHAAKKFPRVVGWKEMLDNAEQFDNKIVAMRGYLSHDSIYVSEHIFYSIHWNNEISHELNPPEYIDLSNETKKDMLRYRIDILTRRDQQELLIRCDKKHVILQGIFEKSSLGNHRIREIDTIDCQCPILPRANPRGPT